MILKNLFKESNSNQQYQQAKMLNGYSPIFSQFGQNVYASDVVQMCIDVIATECSKLIPKHIRKNSEGMQSTVNSSINRLFKFSPNELMTTRDFLEKIIWQLYFDFNSFIYPMYTTKEDSRGMSYREYTGFYPLNPTVVTFLQDNKQDIFVELQFANGTKFTLAYADVIHLRKRFSVNDVMGGGMDGQPDNTAILKVLNINDSVLQGLDKAIKTSLSVRGIININTMMDDEAQKAERAKFEAAIASGKTGIMALDLKNEYIDIKPNPKIVDKDVLDFLQNKILNYYGVSVPILTGDYTDEQYQAFYEKTLEPLVISLGQAFSKTIFSQRELDVGNEVVFYQKDMMYLSTSAKLDLLKTAGEQGLLTDNQKLGILGYPPIPDGDKRTISLNYIDVNLANAYQMSKKGNTNGGGNEVE
ncbi:phage portal protein [Ornithinibacillus xuwenensis]|uniref:Phage portal protein n=1 Tax=Ornithinibacillus xuwenensis TaxID=3144668 RepID=A0ABU9XBN6_9BACI